ncbi:unnamed protein product [Trichogramma brassicae]|uniref:Reverse transcriptase domain-containing protein n=1 Tax=Trichogramma brassicae TaxID=86971 RepID=A0A6H5J1H0_9HYME|nr:unnamed protein product [Trichogramma brassicae]
MYLQVRLHPDDWKLQSILWREDPNQEIDHYVLTTITFGCGPSAFLANRTLRRLAEDDGDKFPLAPPIIHNEMYMDDVLSGAFDLKTAIKKRDQLNSLLASGGFCLAKWMTNDSTLLSSFEPASLAKEATLKVGLGFSVLGLVWEPQSDVFRFNVCVGTVDWPDNETQSVIEYCRDVRSLRLDLSCLNTTKNIHAVTVAVDQRVGTRLAYSRDRTMASFRGRLARIIVSYYSTLEWRYERRILGVTRLLRCLQVCLRCSALCTIDLSRTSAS